MKTPRARLGLSSSNLEPRIADIFAIERLFLLRRYRDFQFLEWGVLNLDDIIVLIIEMGFCFIE